MDTGNGFLFDDYFDTINLNDELKEFYKLINDEETIDNFNEESNLVDIINSNYKRYNNINLLDLNLLSSDFEEIIKEIKKIYSFINKEELLNNNIEEALENQKIIDAIYYHLDKLNNMVEYELDLLEKENNDRQQQIKNIDYSNIDDKTLQKILNKYNDIVLFNSSLEDDLYSNYNKQLKRKKYLNDLYKLINIEIEPYNERISNKEKLNIEINNEIKNINEKILYLEDLIMEDSKYINEFSTFKKYFKNLIAYDDNDYTDLNRVHYTLCENLKIKSLINYFEDTFIKEMEDSKKEEEFVYEKYGIKNIKTSLDYISSNYIDNLNEEEKELINLLYKKLDNENNIDEIYNRLKLLVNNIWKKFITDVYSYRTDNDFCFICTNNQFIDPKHESILITKKMLERVDDYSNYQIGFICEYNDNILYVTENEDIMTVDYNDMSNLKTPKQIEQEFLNFKVCNRLALNGYITKMCGVYFIDDGDSVKYKKAVTLSNQYKLPLIVLKKDKN